MNIVVLMRDFWGFLKVRKKFWLLPIILALLIISALIFYSGTASMTFIYTVF